MSIPFQRYEATYTCMNRSCRILDYSSINIQKGLRKSCPSCGTSHLPTVEVIQFVPTFILSYYKSKRSIQRNYTIIYNSHLLVKKQTNYLISGSMQHGIVQCQV